LMPALQMLFIAMDKQQSSYLHGSLIFDVTNLYLVDKSS
jgi:hypothetical protein